MKGRLHALTAALAAVLALAGCGAGTGTDAHTVGIALDFTPNPAHAPIYLALRDGLDRRLGVHLQIRIPGSGPDTLKLLAAGRAQIGVLDIDDLALARERGIDVLGVAALVQRPLSAILAQPGIHRPRELDGRRIGVSGLPSDLAFMRALVDGDGGHFSTVHPVTIGFAAVAQMAAGNVAAVPAFWSDEGVALRLRGIPVNEFRIERYGAPVYPEVVLVALRSTLAHRRGDVVRALAAIARGARRSAADPAAAASVIENAAGGGDPRLVTAQTRALAGAQLPALTLHRAVLQAFSAFSVRTGLLPAPLDVNRAFDFSLAPEAVRLAGG